MIPKRVKIWFYQMLANALMKKLEKTEDPVKWNRIFRVAWDFNTWCEDNDIYLK